MTSTSLAALRAQLYHPYQARIPGRNLLPNPIAPSPSSLPPLTTRVSAHRSFAARPDTEFALAPLTRRAMKRPGDEAKERYMRLHATREAQVSAPAHLPFSHSDGEPRDVRMSSYGRAVPRSPPARPRP